MTLFGDLKFRRVLYLWAGKSKSGLAAFRDANYEIISVGIDEDADLTICKDIIDVSYEEIAKYGPFDFIWASPDCKVWSLAALHVNHWEKTRTGFEPLTERAKGMIERVRHTLLLIEALNPPYWVMENPYGMLRHMPFMKKYMRAEVTYCQYGDERMKPTDLWGRFPANWNPKRCQYGASCHVPSPRGSNTGTQKLSWEERIKIPYKLSRSFLNASITSYGKSWPSILDYIDTDEGKGSTGEE